jgi:hypothetical protein
MIIECSRCAVRETDACEDCIVTALCGPGGILELAEEERAAIDAMSTMGLVAPIRMVTDDLRRSSG